HRALHSFPTRRSSDLHLSIQPNNATGEEDSKVIIGAESSDADGILVLESEDKAMVLPMVEDTDSILNPAPGMMVYVNKEGRKRLDRKSTRLNSSHVKI